MTAGLAVAGALLGAALTAQAGAAPSARVPLDGVAAVVERRVITTSEVEAEARLVLLEKAGPDVALGPLDPRLLAAVLDTVVAQELLALEARRTGVAVREMDIDKTVTAVRARLPDADGARDFFARIGADEELLRSRARRDLGAQALLSRIFADVKVTDEEVTAALREHPEQGGPAEARAALEKARRDAAFADLLRRIRQDVEVRLIAAAGQGAAGQGASVGAAR